MLIHQFHKAMIRQSCAYRLWFIGECNSAVFGENQMLLRFHFLKYFRHVAMFTTGELGCGELKNGELR